MVRERLLRELVLNPTRESSGTLPGIMRHAFGKLLCLLCFLFNRIIIPRPACPHTPCKEHHQQQQELSASHFLSFYLSLVNENGFVFLVCEYVSRDMRIEWRIRRVLIYIDTQHTCIWVQ